MIQFMGKIMKMPFPWNIWVMLLGMVNMLGGLYFISFLEGKIALAAMMVAFMVMYAIYLKLGFVRLLGLGHILTWTPFLFLCVYRVLSENSSPPEFRIWLVSVSALNSVSLLLDFIDLFKYISGEKSEIL